MDLKLKGKIAFVTGATAGIGLAIVKALTAEGVILAVDHTSLPTSSSSMQNWGTKVFFRTSEKKKYVEATAFLRLKQVR